MLLVFCFLIVPVGDRDALLRAAGAAAGDRLDDGGAGLGGGRRALVLLDLPTGATIVATFGLALLLLAFARPLLRMRSA